MGTELISLDYANDMVEKLPFYKLKVPWLEVKVRYVVYFVMVCFYE